MELQKKPTEAKAAQAAAANRRKHPRTQKYGPQKLTITPPEGRRAPIEGTLWDFSEGGVGMDVPCALDIDEIVTIEGDLHSPGLSMRLKGHARVAYCRRVEGTNHRVGFGFIDVSYRRLEELPH